MTPGGITARLLADYPNRYADLSAGSGLNALLRDEEHARGFLDRHQDKLLFGSDCDDVNDGAKQCLSHDQQAASRKIFYTNASKLMKIR